LNPRPSLFAFNRPDLRQRFTVKIETPYLSAISSSENQREIVEVVMPISPGIRQFKRSSSWRSGERRSADDTGEAIPTAMGIRARFAPKSSVAQVSKRPLSVHTRVFRREHPRARGMLGSQVAPRGISGSRLSVDPAETGDGTLQRIIRLHRQ
jgi:hypothetical protein